MLIPRTSSAGPELELELESIDGSESMMTVETDDSAAESVNPANTVFPRGVWEQADSMEYINVVSYQPKYAFIVQRLAEP